MAAASTIRFAPGADPIRPDPHPAIEASRFQGVQSEVADNPGQTRFEIRVGGRLAGHADYRRRPGLIAFIHTEVDPELEGQGLGSDLIKAALDQVQEQGLEVLPFCPFVNAFIKRNPEYLDLVPQDHRERFGL